MPHSKETKPGSSGQEPSPSTSKNTRVGCESFLESNSPDIFALCEIKLENSIDASNFSVKGWIRLFYSCAWSCSFYGKGISF